MVDRLDYAYSPPTVLNRLLQRELPLRTCQREGVIIAHGEGCVPPTCLEGSHVMLQLLLRDERRNEFLFGFEVRVDRSILRKYEQQQQKRRQSSGLSTSGLYEREERQPADQPTVSREVATRPIYGTR